MEQSPKQSPAVEPVAWRASWNKAPDGWLLYNSRPDAGPDYTVEPLYSAASLSQLSTKLENAERERGEARQLVTEANNSLYGSQGYFHSTNGGPFDRYHLATPIEELKARCRKSYRIEQERDELRAKLAEARAAAFEEAAQIADEYCATTRCYNGDHKNWNGRKEAAERIADVIRARAVKGAGQS